jgi:hypothetical protein
MADITEIRLSDLEERAADLERNVKAAQLRLITDPKDSTAERDIKKYRQERQLVLDQIEGLKVRDEQEANKLCRAADHAEEDRLLKLQSEANQLLDKRVAHAGKAFKHAEGLWRELNNMLACEPAGTGQIFNQNFRSPRQLLTAWLMNANVIEPLDPADARALSQQGFIEWEMHRISEAREIVKQIFPPARRKRV